MGEDAVLEAAYVDDDCGCPVEEWIVRNISVLLHFEADGTMEMVADGGDWDETVALKATTMEAARAEAFAWIAALPTEEEAFAAQRAQQA